MLSLLYLGLTLAGAPQKPMIVISSDCPVCLRQVKELRSCPTALVDQIHIQADPRFKMAKQLRALNYQVQLRSIDQIKRDQPVLPATRVFRPTKQTLIGFRSCDELRELVF